MRVPLSWSTVESPVCAITLVASGDGVVRLVFGGPERVLPDFPEAAEGEGIAALAARQVSEYFSGHRRSFDVPLDWTSTQGLQFQVLRTLFERVPFGETVSYGELAELSGRPNAARAVGAIMGSNPIALIVPCHRVLASGGGLGGFGYGVETKRRLLVLEGSWEPSLWELDMVERPAGRP